MVGVVLLVNVLTVATSARAAAALVEVGIYRGFPTILVHLDYIIIMLEIHH